MIYELLDTNAYPLVVVASLEDHEEDHTGRCSCGGAEKALKVEVAGRAPVSLKALGLLSAVVTLMTDDGTDAEDRRQIRRYLAKVMEVSA